MSDSDAVERYAFTQVVGANLWRDEPMREHMIGIMAAQSTPGYVRTDDEHRHAASFGQMVHDSACTFGLNEEGEIGGLCVEGCVILPSSEDDASLVMIRVEVNVRKNDA